MGRYYLHKEGVLYGVGECPNGMEQEQGAGIYEVGLGEPPLALTAPPVLSERYETKRAAAYPPIGEQMDALWHAMDKGLLPVVEPFYSSIKSVKDRYPKVAQTS